MTSKHLEQMTSCIKPVNKSSISGKENVERYICLKINIAVHNNMGMVYRFLEVCLTNMVLEKISLQTDFCVPGVFLQVPLNNLGYFLLHSF